MTAMQSQLDTVLSNRLKIEALPHGLRRETLQLSNDMLAEWAKHEAGRPAPMVFSSAKKNGDPHDAWADHGRSEWEWNQEFFRAFHPEFSARLLSVLQRLAQKGHIKEDEFRSMNWHRMTVGFSRTDEVRALAEQLGAIALNMDQTDNAG